MTHDQYVPLEDESEKGESDSFVTHETVKPRPLNKVLSIISSCFWVVSTLSFALLSLILTVQLRISHQAFGTYESGFRTELGPSIIVIASGYTELSSSANTMPLI